MANHDLQLAPSVDSYWMRRALLLAQRAQGRVSPNPAVGAVLVRDGVVVGEGHTMPPGGAHAEIVALRQAGERARGATLYVTLEPCAHYGRTPPCCDALVAAGIARAVIAVRDPFPEVNGRGIRCLRAAGVEVEIGLEVDAAVQINAGFFKRVRSGLPGVTAKFAVSLDGKIATHTGHSHWITGPDARREAHRLRDTHDAILVGIGTVLADNPRLTTRLPDNVTGAGGAHHPVRVVLDSRARCPLDSAMLDRSLPGRTLVLVGSDVPVERVRALSGAGAEVVPLPAHDGRLDPEGALRHLASRGINSVLVEGGSQVHGSLLDAGLVDRIVAFVAPVIIGGAGAPSPIGGLGASTMGDALRLSDIDVQQCGDDVMIRGRIRDLSVLVEELQCSAESSKRLDGWSPSRPLEATTR